MKLVWVLGDQLNQTTNLFQNLNRNDLILFIESYKFAHQHLHHKKKLIFQFSAMRHFAEDLRMQGYKIKYIKFDDDVGKNCDFIEALKTVLKEEKIKSIKIMEAADYDCLELQNNLQSILKNVEIEIVENNLFISTKKDYESQLNSNKKKFLMESYYRYLRKKHKVLMDGDEPIGGAWNYDKENRKPLKNIKTQEIKHPPKLTQDKITAEVIQLVEEYFPEHYGNSENFCYFVNRRQALCCLKSFIENSLANFGDYQDAMNDDHTYLYHSLLSYLMNFGLLHPQEVIQAVEKAYHSNPSLYPINSVEGFIRQILGWREFIRGIYITQMPKYKELNFFENKNKLPSFFWSGETNLNCLKNSIGQTINDAYAHHIQRLMVIGNFCLLADINPQEVCEWYLIVYVDALEWVELPNTLGMSQFGDGGLFATKPYISSGKYIDRMSNYCKSCEYDVKETTSENACPFNYLYWNFLQSKQAHLKSNHRMGIAMKNLKNKKSDELSKIQDLSCKFLKSLEISE
ncbi:MAG: cryptochrome/photolyase family protein [Candidatus Caenarcaniphilales bacterium]|nr:cryptochrome/photolyase family protein [Candidatus Caenarcaniphilales bacterium]